jgi:hypothetical protein
MTLSKLKKCLNPIQRCFNPVQWCKRVATVEIPQLVIVKNHVILRVTLVSYFKMAIRWVDAKQRTIAERVSASLTLGSPVVWVPCPAGASIAVASNQFLPTIGAKSFLPSPSLLYCALRKGGHGRTSKATRARWQFGKNFRTKDGWVKTWEGDVIVWDELLNGRQLAIYIIPRWAGKPRRYQVIYEPRATSKSGRSDVIATTSTLSEAKRKGKAFIKRLGRST